MVFKLEVVKDKMDDQFVTELFKLLKERAKINNNSSYTSQLIKRLMDSGYWCTIDYQHSVHAEVKERFKDIWKEEKFIPFCSVIFPNSEDDDNLCIKVDDVDFDATGPGVWTMSMNHFKQSAGFTSWNEYKQDEPLEEKDAKKVV